MKTQAAVLFEVRKPLRVIELTIPSLKPGQVLIEIAYAGLCGSQLLEIRGKKGNDNYLPHTLGHEGSGTVLEIGPEVTKVKSGDSVVLSWIKGKGRDVPSTVYQSDQGAVQSGAISTFMRHAILSENRVTPLSASIPLREAAIFGCAIPTGAGIVFNNAKIKPGQSVAIFGIGGIGMSVILASKISGANPIIAIDMVEHKLDLAKKLGASHTIHALHEEPFKKIKEIVGEKGLDYTVEAAGSKEAMELAFKSVKDSGGVCVLAGNLSQGDQISIDPFDLIKGKKIIGTWGGSTNPDQDIPRYVELYLSGKLNLERLITHVYTLDEINLALSDLEKGNLARGLIAVE